MMRKKFPSKLASYRYEVEWFDITHFSGWQDPSQQMTAVEVRSLGFIIGKDKDALYLAQDTTDDGVPGGVTRIPFVNIRRKKRLTGGLE